MITHRSRHALLSFALFAGACAPKADDQARPGSDSTTAAATDSTRADSLRADSARARGDTIPTVTTTSRSVAAPSRRDSILGRDSAFGPIGTIDGKGNVTPIKKKP